MKEVKRNRYLEILKDYVINNYKEYLIIVIFFILGIFLGVFFVNNIDEEKRIEIHNYLSSFITDFKNIENLDLMDILKISIKDKIGLTLGIWFFATTIIGIPIVFGIVAHRGFCLGYTISSIISLMGFNKGFLFIIISLVGQNIIFIPILISLAVSGFKFYKAILKDKRRENIKVEFIRHTVFSIVMFIILCLSAIIETFISTNLIKSFITHF